MKRINTCSCNVMAELQLRLRCVGPRGARTALLRQLESLLGSQRGSPWSSIRDDPRLAQLLCAAAVAVAAARWQPPALHLLDALFSVCQVNIASGRRLNAKTAAHRDTSWLVKCLCLNTRRLSVGTTSHKKASTLSILMAIQASDILHYTQLHVWVSLWTVIV